MGLYRLLFHLLGWKVVGAQPNIKKYIMIVAPHTSNWDFAIGVMARAVLKIDVKYLGKKELFRAPFGWMFRWLGGYPVDRQTSKNMVETVAEIFQKEESFVLALAPEGTRSQVSEWRTGFYHMSVRANVPIVCVGFDYVKKQVVLRPPFFPSGSIDRDMPLLRAQYDGIQGKNH